MDPKQAPRAAVALSARHIAPETASNALTLGTAVLTLDGALPVEYLTPGDRVITRTSGVARLIGLRTARRRIDAVAIAAGTLGNAKPEQDAILCAHQEVLVRDWRAAALFGASQALVPAERLIDGTFIRALGPLDLDLFELVFDTPQIIYADGLELAASVMAPVPA